MMLVLFSEERLAQQRRMHKPIWAARGSVRVAHHEKCGKRGNCVE